MFPFVLQNHHNGYRQVREHIKRKLQNDLGTPLELLTELNNVIAEQEASYSYTFSNEREHYNENLSLKHAKDHLNTFNLTSQQHQKDATIDALNEPSNYTPSTPPSPAEP